MKTRWAHNGLLASLDAVCLSLMIYLTATGARGPHPIAIVNLALVVGGGLFAWRSGNRLGARDERETAIALRASTFSFHGAWLIALLTTAALPFFITEPTVPFRWLADAPILFLMTQQGIKWASEAVMLGRPE